MPTERRIGGLYDVLLAGADGNLTPDATVAAIVRVEPGIDVLPSSADLAGVDLVLMNAVGKEHILRETIAPLRDQYEWILIDAPPSLGLLTVNILAAVDGLVVPMQCEYYALEGLSQLLRTIDLVRKRINPALEIVKVLPTMVDSRSKLAEQVIQELAEFFGPKLSESRIPRNVRLSEAPSFGQAAVIRYPTSKGAQAYRAFAEEVSTR